MQWRRPRRYPNEGLGSASTGLIEEIDRQGMGCPRTKSGLQVGWPEGAALRCWSCRAGGKHQAEAPSEFGINPSIDSSRHSWDHVVLSQLDWRKDVAWFGQVFGGSADGLSGSSGCLPSCLGGGCCLDLDEVVVAENNAGCFGGMLLGSLRFARTPPDARQASSTPWGTSRLRNPCKASEGRGNHTTHVG